MKNLPEVSSSETQFKSVLYNYWKATVNKKIASGHAIYLLRGCSRCFAQCANKEEKGANADTKVNIISWNRTFTI